MNVSVLVAPRKLAHYFQLLKSTHLSSQLATNNFQAILDAENPPKKSARSETTFGWEEYETLEAMKDGT